MSGYGKNNDPNDFTSDEKVNLALKVALGRIQTDLNRNWYQEPNDFIPKTPSENYRFNIPSYNEIKNYLLIDPDIGDGTSKVTNITVDNVMSLGVTTKSLSEIRAGFDSTALGGKLCRSENSLSNSSERTYVTGTNNNQIIGLGPNMFTRYKYYKGVKDQNGNVIRHLTGKNWSNNSNDSVEPNNALLTFKGNGSNDSSTARFIEGINNARNATAESAGKTFYNDLINLSVPLELIHPDNKDDLTKKHPFIKMYIQVPTYTSEPVTSGDNIAFHNPVIEKALGDGQGYIYRITAWSTADNGWTIQTTSYSETLFFLNNPGLIVIYGQDNNVSDSLFSQKYAPMVSYLAYTGETFSDGIISQGDTLPAVEVSNDKDLFINTTDNTIHRLEDNNGTKTWVGIGGGGGGGDGDMEINGVLKIKNDSTTTPENSFSIVNANDDYRFLTTLVGGSSQLYMYDATGNIPIALTSDWNSYFNVTGGNVGIGTDFADMLDNGKKLTIGDFNNVNAKTNGGIYDTLRFCVYTNQASSYHGLQWYNNNNNFIMSAIRSSVGVNYTNCSLHFYTSKNKATPTEKMSIDGDGNVNISPGNLTVSGNTNIGNTTIGGTLTTTGNTTITGRVGIGTNTTNAYNKLYVYGGAYFSNGYFKVNDDNGDDIFWIMNGNSYFKSPIKIDQGVKIGRDTSMTPDSTGSVLCKFSNGNNSNAYLRAYYSTTNYLTFGAYSSYNFVLSTGSPLKLGGDGGYKMTLNTSGATIHGSLTVTGSVTANGETLTGGGGGGQYLLIDGHKWATTAGYASLSYKTLNQETNGTYGLLLDSAGSTYINAYYNNHIYFLNNDVQIGVFSSSGKFGIGNIATSTMSSELEVHGSAYVSNNVGIGTNSPTRQLHLHNSSSGGLTYLMLSNNATGTGENDGFQIINENDGAVALKQRENNVFKVFTNNTERLRILGNGRIGIGTTNPADNLHVYNGGIWVTGAYGNDDLEGVRIYSDYSNGNTGGWVEIRESGDAKHGARFGYSGSANYWCVQTRNNSTTWVNKFRINRTSNMYMDTNIYVAGTMNSTGRIHINASNAGIWFGNGSNNTFLGTAKGGSSPYVVGYYRSGNSWKGPVFNTEKGYVGIGVTDPTVPLHCSIGRSASYTMDYYDYGIARDYFYDYDDRNYVWRGGWVNASNKSVNLGGYFNESVRAYRFFVTSDRRIKDNITDIPDNKALELLRKIPCRYYGYKDKLAEGPGLTPGFIAQEVMEVFPMAVSNDTSAIIPNEYRAIENPIWNEIIDNSGNKKYKLTIPDLKEPRPNNDYKFYFNDISKCSIESCEHVIKSMEDDPYSFILDEKYERIFLYGNNVDDFHILDKSKLFTINFSATQEIDRIQQQQLLDISGNKFDIELLKLENETLKTENNELVNKINNLENQNANVLSRLEAIEKRLEDANI